jgi:curved DNA-binding protein CbpA
MVDLYGVLGVTPNASQDDIKRAGKQRRRETHPDVGGDPEAFIAVGRALAILSDPEARQRYDQTGDAEPRSAENEIQANAMSYLNGLVINLVESGAVDSPFGDAIGSMRSEAMSTRNMVLRKIDELNMRVRKIERNKDKFRRLKGENFLKRALEQRLSELRKVMIAVERERDVYDKAVDLLVSYRFDRDDPMPWGYPNDMASANPQPQSATATSPVDDFVARLTRAQQR